MSQGPQPGWSMPNQKHRPTTSHDTSRPKLPQLILSLEQYLCLCIKDIYTKYQNERDTIIPQLLTFAVASLKSTPDIRESTKYRCMHAFKVEKLKPMDKVHRTIILYTILGFALLWTIFTVEAEPRSLVVMHSPVRTRVEIKQRRAAYCVTPRESATTPKRRTLAMDMYKPTPHVSNNKNSPRPVDNPAKKIDTVQGLSAGGRVKDGNTSKTKHHHLTNIGY